MKIPCPDGYYDSDLEQDYIKLYEMEMTTEEII